MTLRLQNYEVDLSMTTWVALTGTAEEFSTIVRVISEYLAEHPEQTPYSFELGGCLLGQKPLPRVTDNDGGNTDGA